MLFIPVCFSTFLPAYEEKARLLASSGRWDDVAPMLDIAAAKRKELGLTSTPSSTSSSPSSSPSPSLWLAYIRAREAFQTSVDRSKHVSALEQLRSAISHQEFDAKHWLWSALQTFTRMAEPAFAMIRPSSHHPTNSHSANVDPSLQPLLTALSSFLPSPPPASAPLSGASFLHELDRAYFELLVRGDVHAATRILTPLAQTVVTVEKSDKATEEEEAAAGGGGGGASSASAVNEDERYAKCQARLLLILARIQQGALKDAQTELDELDSDLTIDTTSPPLSASLITAATQGVPATSVTLPPSQSHHFPLFLYLRSYLAAHHSNNRSSATQLLGEWCTAYEHSLQHRSSADTILNSASPLTPGFGGSGSYWMRFDPAALIRATNLFIECSAGLGASLTHSLMCCEGTLPTGRPSIVASESDASVLNVGRSLRRLILCALNPTNMPASIELHRLAVIVGWMVGNESVEGEEVALSDETLIARCSDLGETAPRIAWMKKLLTMTGSMTVDTDPVASTSSIVPTSSSSASVTVTSSSSIAPTSTLSTTIVAASPGPKSKGTLSGFAFNDDDDDDEDEDEAAQATFREADEVAEDGQNIVLSPTPKRSQHRSNHATTTTDTEAPPSTAPSALTPTSPVISTKAPSLSPSPSPGVIRTNEESMRLAEAARLAEEADRARAEESKRLSQASAEAEAALAFAQQQQQQRSMMCMGVDAQRQHGYELERERQRAKEIAQVRAKRAVEERRQQEAIERAEREREKQREEERRMREQQQQQQQQIQSTRSDEMDVDVEELDSATEETEVQPIGIGVRHTSDSAEMAAQPNTSRTSTPTQPGSVTARSHKWNRPIDAAPSPATIPALSPSPIPHRSASPSPSPSPSPSSATAGRPTSVSSPSLPLSMSPPQHRNPLHVASPDLRSRMANSPSPPPPPMSSPLPPSQQTQVPATAALERSSHDHASGTITVQPVHASQHPSSISSSGPAAPLTVNAASSTSSSHAHPPMSPSSRNFDRDRDRELQLQRERDADREREREREREAARLLEEKKAKIAAAGLQIEQAKKFTKVAFWGEVFLKHGRRGAPHERNVTLEVSGSELKFDWSSGQLRAHKSEMKLLEGKATAVFQRTTADKSRPERCFSIVTAQRTLDLEAHSEQAREYWVNGIKLLLKYLK